jgi:hypothetical protein
MMPRVKMSRADLNPWLAKMIYTQLKIKLFVFCSAWSSCKLKYNGIQCSDMCMNYDKWKPPKEILLFFVWNIWIKIKWKISLIFITLKYKNCANNIVLLRDVFHIGLVIDPRPAVLAWGAAERQYSRPRTYN